jgi:hypothetical protein
MHRLWLVMALAAGGCHPGIYFTDDEGAPFSSGFFLSPHEDDLSLPYALGTTVVLVVHQAPRDLTGWTITSDTPAVFSVDNQQLGSDGTLTANGHALAEGDARLLLSDNSGNERHATPVQVRAADSARLFSHGDLRVLGGDAKSTYTQAELAEARIVAGGKAVIAVGYFHASQRVYGHGIATVPAVSSLTVERKTSAGLPVNEWLFVTPAQVGTYQIAVQQSGNTLATLPITAVADADVTGLSIAAEPTGDKSDDDKTWLLARARGSDGREVLGVYCDWTLDGVAQTDENQMAARGDLYRYHYAKGGSQRMVVASHGTVSANIAVQAKDGYVSNTTYLGCSTVPAGRGDGAGRGALLVVACILAFGSLRRFSSRAPRT